MVFQHFAVFDALTVLENIALGLEEGFPAQSSLLKFQSFANDTGYMLN